MDAAGAQALAERIAQHQHWLQAEAVRTGAQAAADPDAYALEEIGDGYRLYRPEPVARPAGGAWRMRKELVGGRWETSVVAAENTA
jgi:hypothetical protein